MVVIESQYFPPIEYFSLLKAESEITIDRHEHFVKQTYRNRCYILTSNQSLMLSIPLKGVNKKIKTGEIRIDYSEDWRKDHWRAITSAYRRSPFFEFYETSISELIHKEHDLLIDKNQAILSFCLQVLQLDAKIKYSEKYQEKDTEGVLDYRSVIHPKKSHLDRTIFTPKKYIQTFGKDFVENLSILDLIFCCGPESADYI